MANALQDSALLALGRQPSETLYDFLGRRERELEAQTAARRSELEAMDTELAHVRSALRQIGNIPSFGRTVPSNALTELSALANSTLAGQAFLSANALVQPAKSNPPTIKDMILQALWTGFRETGATQAELRQFIRDAYGRDIDRTSMSPQISRLNLDGLIKQKGGEDNWRLTVKARQMFDRHYKAENPDG